MANVSGAELSQAEDNIDLLLRNKFFKNVSNGVFVDIGAARPDYLSMSAMFRSAGWTVVSIEPNPAYKPQYEKLGYTVLPYACGDHDEDGVEFSVVNSHSAAYRGGNVSFESFSSLSVKNNYSGLSQDLDVTKIKVDLRRLDTILRVHAQDIDHIDIVSVDVEGWEMEALSGLSFEKFRPTVLIVENLFVDSRYRKRMKSLGYVLWKYLPPNEIYVRPEMIGILDKFLSSARNLAVTSYWRSRRWLRRTLRGH